MDVNYTLIIITAIIMISLIIIAKIVITSDKDNKVRFEHNECLDEDLESKTTFEINSKNNKSKKNNKINKKK